MIVDDASTLKYLWETLLTIALAIIGWFSKRTVETLDKVEEATNNNTLDLAKYKTEVAMLYAKEASVQESLGRVHDRIDDIYHLSDEIKNILIHKNQQS